jgi:hypothetical protein
VTRFTAASRNCDRLNPTAGTIQKVTTSVPATAPSVLAAYNPPTIRRLRCSLTVMHAIAGKVAPMAMVAGSSRSRGSRKVMPH